MHTVELLEQAIAAAQKAGFTIRQDWLGTGCGGDCEIKGQKWILLDLAQSPLEQLETVLDALAKIEPAKTVAMPTMLAEAVERRKAA